MMKMRSLQFVEGFDSVPLRPLRGSKSPFDGGVLSGKAKGVPAHGVHDLVVVEREARMSSKGW
jgi:hypothetical protein